MDGTAVGILGTLAAFSRYETLVSAVSIVPDRQYLMREPKLRAFVDAVFTSSKAAGIRNEFVVVLKASLWRRKEELTDRLFYLPGSENNKLF